MKSYDTETVSAEVLTDVRCNVCGHPMNQNELGYYDDYISIEKKWGYHSPIDGETHTFDICADCYFDWIKQFKIPPQTQDESLL